MTTIISLPLRSGTWTLDPVHSSVEFTVRHLGLAKVRGSFARFDATLSVGDDLATTAVHATIEVDSVDTANPDRDAHLRTSDFFDAASHPTMKFSSTAISGTPDDGYRLIGELTLHGVTRPVDLDVEFFGTSIQPMDQSERAGFTATGSISRKDFGMEFNVPLGGDKFMVSDTVNIELNIQLVGPQA